MQDNRIVIDESGFQWLTLTRDEATAIYNQESADVKELCALDSDLVSCVCDTRQHLKDFEMFGIAIGYIDFNAELLRIADLAIGECYECCNPNPSADDYSLQLQKIKEYLVNKANV